MYNYPKTYAEYYINLLQLLRISNLIKFCHPIVQQYFVIFLRGIKEIYWKNAGEICLQRMFGKFKLDSVLDDFRCM